MIELSKRLACVASYIDNDVILADIGSDHAYIPCLSVMEGKVKKAYACEVVEGPLQSSIKTIEENALQGKVIPVLSDGLKNVPSDVEEFVIAGMGAYTILTILQDSVAKVKQCRKGIIQTNSHGELIRAYLSEQKYHILNEEIIEEDGKYYEIIVFEPINGVTLSEEIQFGPCHLKAKTPLFCTYYQSMLATKKKILENLDSHNPKYAILESECNNIQKMLQL